MWMRKSVVGKSNKKIRKIKNENKYNVMWIRKSVVGKRNKKIRKIKMKLNRM